MKELNIKYPGIEIFREEMKKTPQNPAHHGEGDVYSHTELVMEKLQTLPVFRSLSEEHQEILLLSAALHDAGKSVTTRMENGEWVSPHHSSVGAQRVREFLWRDCGLCGSSEKQRFREAVCNLIQLHSLPLFAFERPEGLTRLAKLAEAPATVEMLCLLAEADVLGRIAPDVPQLLEKVQLTAALAEENGILHSPMQFASPVTKRAWFSGRNVYPGQSLYDDVWGEVTLMSGLPGVGKDTWIRENCDLPMISLDEIRKELKIDPSENQGAVVREGRNRAKELLRRKQPFVWNATDLTQSVRAEQISLFEAHGAAVKIVYLETDWKQNTEQNRNRKAAVPDWIMDKLLGILQPPIPWEAREVQWITD